MTTTPINEAFLDQLRDPLERAVQSLIAEARHTVPGDLFVLGCSTSEVIGEQIGKASSEAVGERIIETILPIVRSHGLALAVQGCEHINRALVVERSVMRAHHLEEVNVVPALHAGGACSMAAFRQFEDPVMVEHIVATVGMDIGDTEIGMHVRHVQRPIRLSIRTIGHARLTALMYRPKLIGGERAMHYK